MFRAIIVVALIAGCAIAQSENSLDVDNIKSQIPGLEGLNEEDLPQKEEVEKVLKEKCNKNGGPGTYEAIVDAKDNVQECMSKYLNQSVIMDELELAKKDGSMDEVFGKYCRSRKEIMGCVTDITGKIEKCLEPQEKDNMKIVMNITDSLIDFLCYKDGDRLAMFVAEGGFECLSNHKNKLQECANTTLSSRIPKDLSLTNLPMFTFSETTGCDDMESLKKCVVKELETCENNTPANIVEALFKFIKKVSPCKNYKPGAAPVAEHNPEATTSLAPVQNDQFIGNKVKRSQSLDFTSVDNFREKCNKYATPSAFEDFYKSVNESKLCIQTLLRQPNACTLLLDEGKRCVSRAVNKMRICLPPQESYLPAFVIASVDNGLQYLCDKNGYNFHRFLDGLPCMISSQYGNELNNCMASTKTRKSTDNVVSKAELCEGMDSIKICLSTYISNRCSQMPYLKETTMGLVEAVKSPCAGCAIYSNAILLLGALIFYFFTRNNAYITN